MTTNVNANLDTLLLLGALGALGIGGFLLLRQFDLGQLADDFTGFFDQVATSAGDAAHAAQQGVAEFATGDPSKPGVQLREFGILSTAGGPIGIGAAEAAEAAGVRKGFGEFAGQFNPPEELGPVGHGLQVAVFGERPSSSRSEGANRQRRSPPDEPLAQKEIRALEERMGRQLSLPEIATIRQRKQQLRAGDPVTSEELTQRELRLFQGTAGGGA